MNIYVYIYRNDLVEKTKANNNHLTVFLTTSTISEPSEYCGL